MKNRNIFACLVHENPDCVIDLVRNLHSQDPSSTILLYNGSTNAQLLANLSLESYGAIIHPSPTPMAWGRLHDFALDCMSFALNHLEFETLTIVDSDQLAVRPGYSEHLSTFLQDRSRIGLLGSSPGILPRNTHIGPVQAAYQEFALWLPFLHRFPQGEQKFAHWTFWPSTVFTCNAASELTRFFSSDAQLQSILQHTRIWATEEVILPTLTALLGFEVGVNPCSYDYVKYRAAYTPAQLEDAFCREDTFWIHPVPRRYDDPLRSQIRERCRYSEMPETIASQSHNEPGLILSVPILRSMKRIQGWLEEDEADLLIATASRALNSLPSGSSVVEVGSFCGRSTVVLGSVVKALGTDTRVYAIDPHDGKVGAADQGLQQLQPTIEIFRRNIAENGLARVVETIPKPSFEVVWQKPIGFLFIDGLHDYENVSRDFHHFENWVVPGGYVAFHDYANYYPGVKTFVNEVLAGGRYEKVCLVNSMMVLKKIAESRQSGSTLLVDHAAIDQNQSPIIRAQGEIGPQISTANPLVSCIMPTADRRLFAPQAIRHFLRQDYPNRELVVIDDGADSIAGLIPADDRIRYIRLQQRQTMGAKHNMACDLARGEIIVHWDDDDWIAHWRLSYQVKELMSHSVSTLCGLSHLLFYDPRSDRAWKYIYPAGGRPWVSGATFCYYKCFWEQHRFPNMNEGADTVFVWELKDANIVPLPDHTFYIATVHPHNTSRKHTESDGWHPLPSQEIRHLLNEEDWLFYQTFRAF